MNDTEQLGKCEAKIKEALACIDAAWQASSGPVRIRLWDAHNLLERAGGKVAKANKLTRGKPA